MILIILIADPHQFSLEKAFFLKPSGITMGYYGVMSHLNHAFFEVIGAFKWQLVAVKNSSPDVLPR